MNRIQTKRDLLNTILRAAKTTPGLDAFLNDLFTPAEYDTMVQRWRIVHMLHQGIPQRDIAKALKVSPTKITRGSRELRNPKGGFNQVLAKR